MLWMLWLIIFDDGIKCYAQYNFNLNNLQVELVDELVELVDVVDDVDVVDVVATQLVISNDT